jgi:hypothetical protein
VNIIEHKPTNITAGHHLVVNCEFVEIEDPEYFPSQAIRIDRETHAETGYIQPKRTSD